jgi:hypothetical protein
VQGHLFGKPMPATEFSRRFKIRTGGASGRRVEALETGPA